MHSIGQADLEAFAQLSGDFNPVHIDPNFAYKSYFRGQIVYGIYQVLFVLEKHLSRLKDKGSLEGLGDLVGVEANFDLPLYKDEKFVIRLIEDPREVLKSLDSIDCEVVRDTGGGGGACMQAYRQACSMTSKKTQEKTARRRGQRLGNAHKQAMQSMKHIHMESSLGVKW